MEIHFYLSIAVIWLFAAMMPGLNFFITVQAAISGTYKESLCTVCGIVTGTCIWSLCGYQGLTLLFTLAPTLYWIIKIFGGLYLCYLGFKMLKARPRSCLNKVSISRTTVVACFRKGLLTNLLNPKTAMFITSLYAAVIPPDHTFHTGLISSLLMCLISLSWYTFVALLLSGKRIKTLYEHYKGYVEKVAGGLFLFFGLKLAIAR